LPRPEPHQAQARAGEQTLQRLRRREGAFHVIRTDAIDGVGVMITPLPDCSEKTVKAHSALCAGMLKKSVISAG